MPRFLTATPLYPDRRPASVEHKTKKPRTRRGQSVWVEIGTASGECPDHGTADPRRRLLDRPRKSPARGRAYKFCHADEDPDPREVSATNDDAPPPHLHQIVPDQLRINALTVTVRLTLHPPMASDS
jgi:hypothetical protein